MENYLMPHATPKTRAGLAAFPKMIPNSAKHPNAVYINQIRRELEVWNIPVSVIWPDGDMAWKPDEGARIAQMVPDGELYLVRNAGHFLQEDAGDEVANQLIRFLDKRIKPRVVSQAVAM